MRGVTAAKFLFISAFIKAIELVKKRGKSFKLKST